MKQKTKARQLMRIAYATYQRDEPEIAKDIFVLAMEHPTAAVEFGDSKGELEKRLRKAVAAGQYDQAAECLDAMESADDGEFIPESIGEDVDDDVEEEEAALSPGDFVEPLPAPELAPAQVASLVTLARKIRADGHPDLARRITKALGL